MKKIIIVLILSVLLLAGCAPTSYMATSTYTVDAVPAIAAGEVKYTTAMSGTYIIGESPSEYVTGEEKEFTTAESGIYIAGEDFPAGTYDLEAVSGNGNVFAGSLNEIMGVDNDEFYLASYDNYTFEEGEELEVSGVSLKLVPQTNDTFVIEPGTYDLKQVEGSGNVFAGSLNEIMSPPGDDFGVSEYDNYTFTEGEEFEVSGVSLDLVTAEETPEVPAYDVVEELTFDVADNAYTCTVDGEDVEDCKTLKNYDTLVADIEAQKTAE